MTIQSASALGSGALPATEWWRNNGTEVKTRGEFCCDAVRLGHMRCKVAMVLTCNLFANAANVVDAGLFLWMGWQFRVHDLFSTIIRSGVTICGIKYPRRAQAIIKWVRLLGLARCFWFQVIRYSMR